MSKKIVVPEVGESITEGVIASWLKKDGDYVESGESIYELETDKVTTEVPADESGILKIKVSEGEVVEIGATIGELTPGEKPASAEKQAASESPKAPSTNGKAASKGESSDNQVVNQVEKETADRQATQTHAKPQDLSDLDLSPSKRRQVHLGNTAVLEHRSSVQVDRKPDVETKRMSPLRQRIAERLVSSQRETATLTTFNEVDMSQVMELRSLYKDPFKEKHGISLGFMGFFVKAAIEALKAVPSVNGQIDGQNMVFHNYYDIGIAVSTPKGLVVPVLRNCEQKSLWDIEAGIMDLAIRARDSKLKLDEMQGGTFTISNGGVFGSLLSTPILNPPQTGILGMHKIEKRPVVVDDHVVIRPMMYIALSYDHRMIDGKESVTFLKTVKEYVENPGKFLLNLEG